MTFPDTGLVIHFSINHFAAKMHSDMFATLICMILRHLDDLYSIIRAFSHVHLGSFTGSKEIILGRIVPKFFPDTELAVQFLGTSSRQSILIVPVSNRSLF